VNNLFQTVGSIVFGGSFQEGLQTAQADITAAFYTLAGELLAIIILLIILLFFVPKGK